MSDEAARPTGHVQVKLDWNRRTRSFYAFCPGCRYFLAFSPVAHDDAGYEIPGACQHPSIGMELFVSTSRPELALADCSLRWTLPDTREPESEQQQ